MLLNMSEVPKSTLEHHLNKTFVDHAVLEAYNLFVLDAVFETPPMD
jgi:hypothetical protein